jgi:hypothetical protein
MKNREVILNITKKWLNNELTKEEAINAIRLYTQVSEILGKSLLEHCAEKLTNPAD